MVAVPPALAPCPPPAHPPSAPPGPRAAGVHRRDPRVPFAGLLATYCALGCTVLGFNRSPLQILGTVAACLGLDVCFDRLLRRGQPRRERFGLSAAITGMGLSILLNYAHHPWLLFVPAFFAVASKYLLTFEGRHVFNPALCGVVGCLTLGGGLFASAPAYQWGGTLMVAAPLVMAALSLFVFKIGRTALIVSFLGFYALQTTVRAWLLRWHLPMETVLVGSFTSPAFFLFAFYMITDPRTSPVGPRAQVGWSLAVVLADAAYHFRQSLATLFFALFAVSAARWAFLHGRRLWRLGPWAGLRAGLFNGAFATRGAAFAGVGALGLGIYGNVLQPRFVAPDPGFRFEPVPAAVSGVSSQLGNVLNEVDPRVAHVAKWLLSVGDAVAVGDFDNDGLPDLFLTNPLKRPEDRNALYRNLGGFRFERVPLPALDEVNRHPETYGLVAHALFVDYDNSGRESLVLSTAFGRTILLKNRPGADGRAEFVDVTRAAGLGDDYTISVAATALDFDNDGNLDLFVANSLSPYLSDYDRPTEFNIFHLPPPAYPGDRRMFHFMHHGWQNAENGGLNLLYKNRGDGTFEKLDAAKLGMPETHWTLAVGAADLNHDGFPDLYCASDFGPDDLYLNEGGKHFRRVQGRFFGSIGRDTYKGMNVSIGDLDNRGWPDVYVSNVHVPLQAEGSLLWRVSPDEHDAFVPRVEDTATARGALNEGRFGWGAAMGDVNLDGALDLVQANGMVDDTPDRRFPTPRDYWYRVSYVMRSGPETHAYADRWPDLRGYEIFGRQRDRVYLSRGPGARPQFADVAAQVGLDAPGNSRAVALADFDNDGALDLVVTHQFAPASIYRNTLHERDAAAGRPPHHWLGLALAGDGKTVNREAAGARVVLRYTDAAGKPAQQTREVMLNSGFGAQGDRRLLFGLGEYAGPVEVEIRWPNGRVETMRDLALDRYHALRFGGQAPVLAEPLAAPAGLH